MSETKTNFKNELKSAASLILTFSLPILQHYHIHQNAPLKDLGSGEPAEQFVDGGPASDGVEEVAGDQLEVVLGREHLQKHDPAASYVLGAALHGF